MLKADVDQFDFLHCTGIDTGSIIGVHAGLSGLNDLVWVGKAFDFSFRLSQNRTAPFNSYLSEATFFMLFEQAKFSVSQNQLMWEETNFSYDNKARKVYCSKWWQEP
ncbi:MAG: hypothetical protein GX638_09600 [Crenarchaeota archaeon]|nr:hypothetical protein [Thermoproteota archaeon]